MSNRVDEWVRVVHEAVTGATGGPPPKVLATHCLVAYGSVLATAGRFDEAEAVMTEALSPSASRNASHRLETTCNLARVRLEQGRVDEAAALLAPYEDRVPACEPIARLRLLQGEPELAAAAARRGLKEMQGDVLRASKLLARLVEAEIALGDLAAANDAADELVALADRGRESHGRGRGGARRRTRRRGAGRAPAGDRGLRQGTSDLQRSTVPRGHGPRRAGRVARRGGESPRAIDEARAAAAVFERIGANGGADRAAALLRQLGAPARVRSAENQERAIAGLSGRELEVLDLVRQGNTNAEIAARLYISPKTAEHHVSRILNKLGVRTRAEAAAARRHRDASPIGGRSGGSPDVGMGPLTRQCDHGHGNGAGPESKETPMFTEVEEIAPDIFRLSTHIEEIAPPAGFTFNQFLIRGDEPFLFHTGMRGLFPLVSEAVNRIVPVTDLRWISFAHVEADECGAMNDFLAVAPNAQVVHGGLAVHGVAQ